MNRRCVAKHLLRARLSALLRAFNSARRIAFILVISTHKRDWGHARDYVEAMWLMLQQDTPEDYVIATGKQHSVRDFVCAVAQKLGIDLRWEGKGQDEVAIDAATGERIVAIDPRYFRPAEVENLLGNAAKAREKLGWAPRTTFDELVTEMVREELEIAKMESSGKRQICSFICAKPRQRMKTIPEDISLASENLDPETTSFDVVVPSGRSLAGNTLWNLFGNCFPVVVAVVCLPMLKRGLGTERLGIISLAWVVIGYFSLFDLGLSRALTKLVAERIGQRRQAGNPVLDLDFAFPHDQRGAGRVVF